MWSRKFLALFVLIGILPMVEGVLAAGIGPWESASEKAKVDQKLLEVEKVIKSGPFKDDWESLKNYKIPEWYQDSKFGIFIHWGLYSVPAFANEWYSRNLYQKDSNEWKHQIATYGPHTKFGYKDFIPKFKAEKFDPSAWAKVFKDAGAKYVVPVAEHHDGFAMYDCGFSNWTAAKMGPRRDVIGDLSREIRNQGLVFGSSSHRAEHWWFMNGGMKFDSDVQDPKYADFYGPAAEETAPDEEYLRNWLARSCELVDKYKPQLLYFDWWIGEKPEFTPFVKKFSAFYYNRAAEWGKEVVLCTKDKAYVQDASVMDVERGKLTGINPRFWQTDTSISWGSWCYIENDNYKDSGLIIKTLVDAVSKNGTLLLNIGPKSDGALPEQGKKVLAEVGQWLKTNGEAIYGTRPWILFGEGLTGEKGGKFNESDVKYQEGDMRFTRKGNAIYGISLVCPTKPLTIASLGTKASPGITVTGAALLGSPETVKWERGPKGLVVSAPAKPGTEPVAYKISVEGAALGTMEVHPFEMSLSVRTDIQNYSGVELNQEVSLVVNGKKFLTKQVSVARLSSAPVSFLYKAEKAGYYRVSLAVPGQPPMAGGAALPCMDLAGEWLFNKGDDLKWAKPHFQDSKWQKVALPAGWESHSDYTADNVYGWYRKHVVIPAAWKGHSLVIPLGKIDDCDAAYFNGVKIGQTGKFPPKFEGFWNQPRSYTVPANLIHWGKDNVISVRVFDATGGGGIYDGPLGPIEVK